MITEIEIDEILVVLEVEGVEHIGIKNINNKIVSNIDDVLTFKVLSATDENGDDVAHYDFEIDYQKVKDKILKDWMNNNRDVVYIVGLGG